MRRRLFLAGAVASGVVAMYGATWGAFKAWWPLVTAVAIAMTVMFGAALYEEAYELDKKVLDLESELEQS